ncbi:glycerol-3-phosphate acyltransferase [Paenibacillus sp. EPM92]|uniref:glycerol-3-phosphate acyltransferase n=1 Tax=Paenibacillus sp. EPM92 TaxID=1561195 RepID=UPI0006D24937|nr:glycerol-3-phosphate acyltransferase [Paenibacillus sp. EPM92]
MTPGAAIAYLLLSYGLGGVLTGYWIARLKDGGDLRSLGSGNPGARNAGRIYGKGAFIATFAGDALKGAWVVGCAKWIEPSSVFILAALLAVVLGHMYPVWLSFRGGKGMSVFCGGAVLLDWRIWLVMLAVAAVLVVVLRSWTPAGLIGVSAFPLLWLLFHWETGPMLLGAAVAAVIVNAHRDNVRQLWMKRS